jgi:N-acetylmuramic acid 6-phosphate etherase
MVNQTYLLFDIGGTWIKAASAESGTDGDVISETIKAPSPLHASASGNEISQVLIKLASQLTSTPSAIVVSTAGVVNYHGSGLEFTAEHLSALLDRGWIENLKETFNCPVNLINDADCALIGAVEKGLVKGAGALGLMVIGTGLGFSVWRNGRRWRPGWSYTLLGSVTSGEHSLNEVVSASHLARHSANNDLCEVLSEPAYADARHRYFKNLARAVETAALLYQLDDVALSGGLVDACLAAGVDLQKEVSSHLNDDTVKLDVFKEGNGLQMSGALAMAKAEAVAEQVRFKDDFTQLKTEQAYDDKLQLHEMSSRDLVRTFLTAEQQAGEQLFNGEEKLADCAELIAERLKTGGRLIYVGCGSSGRIAALDAVELPCTYGLEPDRAICLIAGGIADASIDIEHQFEEDASAVPEMLLLDIQKNDVVIGISASGSAYYVRSALAMARNRSALSILLSVEPPEQAFVDHHIPLCSGAEVLSGSTRMKAGTATKKILNTLSSTAMILMGKVYGTHMVDLACINEKLICRATKILQEIFECNANDARALLKNHDYNLLKAINLGGNQINFGQD